MIENMRFIEIDDNITPKATQQNFHKLPDLKMSNEKQNPKMAKNLKEKLKIHDPQLYMTLSHISKHGNSIEVNKKTAKMD